MMLPLALVAGGSVRSAQPRHCWLWHLWHRWRR